MNAKPDSAIKQNRTLQQYIITEARSELDRQRKYYKDLDKDFKTMNTDELLLNNRKFRKLRPNTRKLAIQRFIKELNREPNFSDIDDTDWLLDEGSFIQKK